MSETTFHNVLITVCAKTPKLAYAKLCQALARADIEYTTDTYTVYEERKSPSTKRRATSLLFPK